MFYFSAQISFKGKVSLPNHVTLELRFYGTYRNSMSKEYGFICAENNRKSFYAHSA
jgi:hypothetical protein